MFGLDQQLRFLKQGLFSNIPIGVRFTFVLMQSFYGYLTSRRIVSEEDLSEKA
jgi:hypothetical protein